MSANDNTFDIEQVSSFLKKCVADTLNNQCQKSFSNDPKPIEKEIIEYNSRMCTFGLSKFNDACFISYLNFFVDEKAMKDDSPIGTFTIYIKSDIAEKLVKASGKVLKDDDSTAILETCAMITQNSMDQFKTELNNLGYHDLFLSTPQQFENDVPDGVAFNYNEHRYIELCFDIDDKKSIVVELTLSPPNSRG